MDSKTSLKGFTEIEYAARGYYANTSRTEVFQLLWAFTFGLLGGPIAYSVEYLIIGLIVNEVIIRYFTIRSGYCWYPVVRIVMACALFLGWMFGRWLFHSKTGTEHFKGCRETVREYYSRYTS